jgi:hypothetical protein
MTINMASDDGTFWFQFQNGIFLQEYKRILIRIMAYFEITDFIPFRFIKYRNILVESEITVT